jgi:hypothetical protein
MYLLILWQIEINVFLGGEFPHPGGKTNGKLGNSVADSLFFGKTICQLFYQKCIILGENFTTLQLSF